MFLKDIWEIKLYIRTIFSEPKGSYSGTIIYPFQGLFRGDVGSPTGWFLIICILLVYLKDKGNGVEIKTEINVEDFKLVAMMFVCKGCFMTLREITDRRYDGVLQQHQTKVYYWSGGLGISGGCLDPEKRYWYTIWCGWIDGGIDMIIYYNAGYIYLTKRYGE